MGSTYGYLSIIPPIIAIIWAIRHKEVYTSLLLGIVAGFSIYIIFPKDEAEASSSLLGMGRQVLHEIVNTFTEVLSNTENVKLLIFLALLGGIISILANIGGTDAMAAWAQKNIHSGKQAQMAAFIMGCIIFIDDYFNSLTVGSMMRPLTDEYKVSRAKLAYIIDSTAAPVTILFPMSSWVATVISMMNPMLVQHNFELHGIVAFISSIPYNYYALLTLLMVILVITLNIDIGPMKKFEDSFRKTGFDSTKTTNSEANSEVKYKKRASIGDILFVICLLVFSAILAMLVSGGFPDSTRSIVTALSNCDAALALVYSGIITLCVMAVLFISKRIITMNSFIDSCMSGMKEMLPSIILLVLAWTFSTVLSNDYLNTASFIANLAANNLPAPLLTGTVFLVTAIIAFSTGASWGTLAIMLPTSITVCAQISPSQIAAVLGATLAGAIFGDHCSPLADTTILSSAGADCNHIDHVVSQLPYAYIVASISGVAYIITGFIHNPYVPLLCAGILMTGIVVFLKRYKHIDKLL